MKLVNWHPLSRAMIVLAFSLSFLIETGAPQGRGADVPATNALSIYRQKTLDKTLRTSARRNDLESLKNALRKGANLDGASPDGFTALMYACRSCYPEIVRYLLESGAAVNSSSQRGRTALILAVRSECLPAVKALLAHPSIKIRHRDGSGKRAIDYASKATVTEVDGPSVKIFKLIRAATKRKPRT